MENQTYIICEWSGCYARASKHACFGYRISEPEIASTLHDLDLCDAHIAEIMRQFLIVTVDDLGEDRDKHDGDVDSTIKRAA